MASVRSYDSGAAPLHQKHYRYESTNTNDQDYQNYRDGDSNYGQGRGSNLGYDDRAFASQSQIFYHPPPPEKKRSRSLWCKVGIPVAIIAIIIAAVIVGIVVARNNNKDKNASTSSSGSGSGSGSGSSGNGGPVVNAQNVFFTSTDGYGLPVYPTTTNTAMFGTPTFNPKAALQWPSDTTSFANPTPTIVRPDHPRLIAPKYKWDALPTMIPNEPYMKSWNDTIFGNATSYLNLDPVAYVLDGGPSGSGVLDPAREVKARIKALAYAYRLSNETVYADRAWLELKHASGNTSDPFGTLPDRWNSLHFLDLAEFTAAFAIGYDWLYDYWTDDQKAALRWSIIELGLNFGISAYTDPKSYVGWWREAGNNQGNWNCVCNSGLTLGALAILGDDTTGTAEKMISLTVPNALAGCAFGPSSDGTWAETANYWYFGTTAHAEMSSSLISAAGSDFGLLTANPAFNLTGLFHMYITGMTSLFNYGDCGPNKYSTTANSMIWYGNFFKQPRYMLHQRDRSDTAEPTGMLWYDPSVSGAFWADMPLDHYFSNATDQWASMRSSWTDDQGMYIAMKAGGLMYHQAHGDLDAGDFVMDAMGERWAGELGNGNYLATGYFSNETQESDRWLYYRKRTEGQNTICLNQSNQDVEGVSTTTFDSSNTLQSGGATTFTLPSDSTALFTANLTGMYYGTSIQRGIRFLNGRKQVLLQDDISNAKLTSEWRVHTNATVTLSSDKTSATLVMPSGKKLTVTLLNPASGIEFSTETPPEPYSTDPDVPTKLAGDQNQPNPGVTVLKIKIPTGTTSLQVLWNPQWEGMSQSSFKTPPSVSIGDWTLTSHDS